MNTELIRLKRISEKTSLSQSTLRNMIKRKELKGVLIGNNYYVRPQDYQDFLLYIECKRLGYTIDQMPKIKEMMNKFQDEEYSKRFKEISSMVADIQKDENRKIFEELLSQVKK